MPGCPYYYLGWGFASGIYFQSLLQLDLFYAGCFCFGRRKINARIIRDGIFGVQKEGQEMDMTNQKNINFLLSKYFR